MCVRASVYMWMCIFVCVSASVCVCNVSLVFSSKTIVCCYNTMVSFLIVN